jgi:hypothetical protein
MDFKLIQFLHRNEIDIITIISDNVYRVLEQGWCCYNIVSNKQKITINTRNQDGRMRILFILHMCRKLYLFEVVDKDDGISRI